MSSNPFRSGESESRMLYPQQTRGAFLPCLIKMLSSTILTKRRAESNFFTKPHRSEDRNGKCLDTPTLRQRWVKIFTLCIRQAVVFSRFVPRVSAPRGKTGAPEKNGGHCIYPLRR